MLFSGERVVLSDKSSFLSLVTANLNGTAAATAGNYGSIFTADRPYQVVEVHEIHEVAGSDGSAVTLDITKDSGTNAPGAGVSVFASGTFNLKGTANTLQTKSAASGILGCIVRGQRLGLKDAGTPTAVAGVQVTVVLRSVEAC